MGKLRKWVAYRHVERPYTRWSKSRKKAFVKSRPGKKVIKFDMGDLVGGPDQFTLKLQLISRDRVQVRANAIEAARITSLRPLEAQLGRAGFYYRIMMHPHHVLRENPLAAGAGADRGGGQWRRVRYRGDQPSRGGNRRLRPVQHTRDLTRTDSSSTICRIGWGVSEQSRLRDAVITCI